MAARSGSPNLPQCDRKPCEIALPRRRGKVDYISIINDLEKNGQFLTGWEGVSMVRAPLKGGETFFLNFAGVDHVRQHAQAGSRTADR